MTFAATEANHAITPQPDPGPGVDLEQLDHGIGIAADDSHSSWITMYLPASKRIASEP